MELGIPQVVFLMGVFFFGYFEQQVSGFGASLFCLPFALLLIPRAEFVPIALIYTLLQSVFIAVKSLKVIQWKELILVLALAGVVGIPISDYLLQYVPERTLKVALAIFIAIYSVYELWKMNHSAEQKKRRAIDLILPIGSGAMQAAYGVGGPLLVAYLSKHIHEKMALRGTICGYWVVLNGIILVKYFMDGMLTVQVATLAAWLLPAVLLGSFLGSRIVQKISQEKFKKFIYMILILSACFLVL